MRLLYRTSILIIGIASLTGCLSASKVTDTVNVINKDVGCPFDARLCLYPSWSPDGSKVVFVTQGSEYGPLVISNANLGDLRPLFEERLFPEGLYAQPVWSPEGDRVAFYLFAHNKSHGIYLANVKDQSLKKLIDLPHGASGLGLNWSPDGKQLLYIKNDELEKIWICIANDDGTSERWIREIGYPGTASWSPDGKKIAFIFSEDEDRTDLFVMDVNGENVLNLSNSGLTELEENIAWSPDSQRLLFTAIDESYRTLLYVINSDGTNKQLISDDRNYVGLAWSPDGQWLVMAEAFPAKYGDGGGTKLIKVKVDF